MACHRDGFVKTEPRDQGSVTFDPWNGGESENTLERWYATTSSSRQIMLASLVARTVEIVTDGCSLRGKKMFLLLGVVCACLNPVMTAKNACSCCIAAFARYKSQSKTSLLESCVFLLCNIELYNGRDKLFEVSWSAFRDGTRCNSCNQNLARKRDFRSRY